MGFPPLNVGVAGPCPSSCKIASPCTKLDGGSRSPESCPYCLKALANEAEQTDNETDSDSEGVYEFTQDAHYSDQRDPQRGRAWARSSSRVLAFWRVVCETFQKIVDSKYFGRGIMVAILINTLSMGIEYHEQVSWLPSLHPASRRCSAPCWHHSHVAAGVSAATDRWSIEFTIPGGEVTNAFSSLVSAPAAV